MLIVNGQAYDLEYPLKNIHITEDGCRNTPVDSRSNECKEMNQPSTGSMTTYGKNLSMRTTRG
jgi:hypothetical protein